MSTAVTASTANDSELKRLLSDKTYITVPKEGDVVKGTVIALSSREILVDIPGFKTGIVRGLEMKELSQVYPNLKIGDPVEATVTELENEEGQVELSFQFAGELRGWEKAIEAKTKNTIVEGKVVEANRGGLMVTWLGMAGFLPVSQLAPEHYPRVPGGDKGKILERLRSFVGTNFRLRVLDCVPHENKLIFSEKTLWEEEQKDLISKYKVGDIVEGQVTAVADFGVFVGFDGLEGLVHISEIAWQRLDHPSQVVKVGDTVRAQVLNIQGSKIFLSIRVLIGDPWKQVESRYAVGQVVKGKILKVNPFGLFVELDPEIHGLAHVSELDITPGIPVEEQVKPGDTREFKVVSIESEHHRLGLSEKKAKAEPQKTDTEPTEEVKKSELVEAPPSIPASDVVQ
ncbi:S1 RNA-binding domain-containing protein [Candidatus Uhrbacteria bacterium]|nr:S1 RNA-binding domain-containing protein [Candidatus Uhrbacteria bacterium]